MADDFSTLAGLVLINDQNTADLDLSDLLDDAPLLAQLPADIASNGTTHKYLKQTGAPVVGFRSVNDGRENDVSVDTLVSVDCKILDGSFVVDKALADGYRLGKDAYIAREAARHLKASFAIAEKQYLSGTVHGAAAGFTGLANSTGLDAVADAMVVNAAGTTASTGSSVFAMRAGADLNDVVAIAGEGGKIEIGETVSQRVEGTTGWYAGYWTPIQAWMAMQIGGAKSVGRIANLTEDSGKGLTDDLIAELLAAFPASRMPNVLSMSRRSLRQLQQSRTATNSTGAPAPFPTEAFGVQIVVTDGQVDTETLIA